MYVDSKTLAKDSLEIAVDQYFETDVKYFAVRSSASNEDSEKEAKAGYYHTSLGVTKDKIYEEAVKVKNSYKGESGTIIIQEFIASDKAGVMFTDAGFGVVAITANFGLCDTVVKGENCDTFILNQQCEVIDKKINVNKKPVYFKRGRFVTDAVCSDLCLTNNDLKVLYHEAKNIQQWFGGKPQDIEFCFKGNTLYILQARPITRPIFNKIEYFDGANIQESFNGVVLPLTFTMAQFGYPYAYVQALKNVGVAGKYITSNWSVFANLLKQHNGRMYYNKNNWYRMLEFIPGRFHKQNFRTMITSDVKDDIPAEIKPVNRIVFFFKTLYEYIVMKPRIKKLVKDANKSITKFNETDISNMNYEELIELLRKYHDMFLHRWYLIGENDFCVATFFGYLKKKYTDEQIAEVVAIKSASTEQIGDFYKLIEMIRKVPDLWQAVVTKDRDSFFSKLPEHKITHNCYKHYFNKYGGRFANELKLETPDLQEDFTTFANLILKYNSYDPDKKSMVVRSSSNIKLSMFDRFMIWRFKSHAVNREDMRLMRSNFFGVLRKIFNMIGTRLYEADIINNPKDIFYMDFQEIYEKRKLSQYTNDNMNDNLALQIARRKLEYSKYSKLNAPSNFVVIDDNELTVNDMEKLEDKKMFQGKGCCPGVVTGRVRVFKDFYVPEDSFDILVAKNTDPGWTPLIGVSKAMIIENGGILSHAAIVARESNIPTVISVQNATDYLKDGQLVRLDGGKGTVEILD